MSIEKGDIMFLNKIEEQGSALITVLIAMVVLMLLGSTFLSHTLTETIIAINQKNNTQAYYVAEAGIEKAVAVLKRNFGFEGNLDGSIGEGSYTVSLGDRLSGKREIISTGTVSNATVTIRVIVGIDEIYSKAITTAHQLMLQGETTLYGNIHVNKQLQVKGTGNVIMADENSDGEFTYYEQDPHFDFNSTIEIQGVIYNQASNMHHFKEDSPLPIPDVDVDYYLAQGYREFNNLTEYAAALENDSEFAAQEFKRIIITHKFNTDDIAGNFSYNGVIVVTGGGIQDLVGEVNMASQDADNILAVIVSDSQNIKVEPAEDGAGELRIGGKILLYTKGNIDIKGKGKLKGERVFVYGTIISNQLTLENTELRYAPEIFDETSDDMPGLGVVIFEWLPG